jgi:hypothetical protein
VYEVKRERLFMERAILTVSDDADHLGRDAGFRLTA